MSEVLLSASCTGRGGLLSAHTHQAAPACTAETINSAIPRERERGLGLVSQPRREAATRADGGQTRMMRCQQTPSTPLPAAANARSGLWLVCAASESK